MEHPMSETMELDTTGRASDHKLLVACGEFHELEAKLSAMLDADGESGVMVDRTDTPFEKRRKSVMAMIAKTPAATLDGLRAKARVVQAFSEEGEWDEHTPFERLLWSVVR